MQRIRTSVLLPDGRLTTGRASELMSAPASGVLNAIKALAGIADNILLLSLAVLEPIQRMKASILKDKVQELNLSEVLLALSLCSATNPTVDLALGSFKDLRGCEAHCTTMLSHTDEDMLRRLGVRITCDPVFANQTN